MQIYNCFCFYQNDWLPSANCVQRLRVWSVADFGGTCLSHEVETTCETRGWITHKTRYWAYPMLHSV